MRSHLGGAECRQPGQLGIEVRGDQIEVQPVLHRFRLRHTVEEDRRVDRPLPDR